MCPLTAGHIALDVLAALALVGLVVRLLAPVVEMLDRDERNTVYTADAVEALIQDAEQLLARDNHPDVATALCALRRLHVRAREREQQAVDRAAREKA